MASSPETSGKPNLMARFEKVISEFGEYFQIDGQAFVLVAMGGGLGGFLWPYVDLFNHANNTGVFENFPWYLRIVIGFAAGGAGTFVLASTDTSRRNHLIFFSLLCGLTAPTLLPNAKDHISQKVIEDTSRANNVTDLRAITKDASANEVSPEAKIWFEERSSNILYKEALTAVAEPADLNKKIKDIKDFGEAATEKGFVKPAEDAVKALTAISSGATDMSGSATRAQPGSSAGDEAVKQSAVDAAQQIRMKLDTKLAEQAPATQQAAGGN